MIEKLKNLNKTTLGVIAFIIVLLLAGYSAKSDAEENGVRVSIGKTIVNSELKVGELSYEYNDWEFSAALVEDGKTKNGFQEQVEIYTVSYLTKPGWGVYGIEPYVRIGASKNSGSKLIGPTNFRLGLGIDFQNVWRVEFNHHSSAGIHNPNTGLDYVTLTYKIPPLF
jgi:hypothetical protein